MKSLHNIREQEPKQRRTRFYCPIEWAKGSILNSEDADIAHEVREKRNDYGHACLKILRKKPKKSPDRRPFTDEEALDTYVKAVKAANSARSVKTILAFELNVSDA